MIIDTSALIAIIASEPEGDSFLQLIVDASSASISAATYLELGIVVERFPEYAKRLDSFLSELDIEIVSVTAAQARIAREAYRHFGKGFHPAGLNYGDCFSYALSKGAGEPLLFKGNDFGKTDIEAVLPEE